MRNLLLIAAAIFLLVILVGTQAKEKCPGGVCPTSPNCPGGICPLDPPQKVHGEARPRGTFEDFARRHAIHKKDKTLYKLNARFKDRDIEWTGVVHDLATKGTFVTLRPQNKANAELAVFFAGEPVPMALNIGDTLSVSGQITEVDPFGATISKGAIKLITAATPPAVKCTNPECACIDCKCGPDCKCAKAKPPAAEPIRVLESPQPAPQSPTIPVLVEKPDVPLYRPVRGKNGWRLRVMHPPGFDRGLRDLFENDEWFREFGVKYGYEAIATNMEPFDPWLANGYKVDRVQIVLINDKGRVVWWAYDKTLPRDEAALRRALEDATLPPSPFKSRFIDSSSTDDCPNCNRRNW